MGRAADTARWAVVTGTFRTLGTLARLTGDPVGTALSGPEFLADPYPFYDDVRRRGRIAPGRLVWPTADYTLCREILRDNRFIKAEDGTEEAPLIFRLAAQRADPKVAHPLLPPSMLARSPGCTLMVFGEVKTACVGGLSAEGGVASVIFKKMGSAIV